MKSDRILTDIEAAKVGLWLDDPFGDGIRLERIREPNRHRIAALKFVNEGIEDIFGDHLIYIKNGRYYASKKANLNALIRHGVIK